MKAARAAIYVRISQDTLGTGLGVARQEKDCRELAARRGWTVTAVYPDDDISAYTLRRKRPGYASLLAGLRSGVHDALVVYNIDRLYRQPRELEDLIDLCETGQIGFATCSGDMDLSTGEGRFYARMLVTMAAKSSDDLSRRQRRKMIEVAEQGKPHGGMRPYGYENDRITVRPYEAAVIGDIATAILGGDSLRTVCLRLNGRGDLSVTGKNWQPSALVRMLLRPRLVGLRSHRGSGEHPAVWPAILDPATQLQLRALLRDPRRRRVGAPPRHLLSGLVWCGKCGMRMVTHPAWGHNRRAYNCPPPPRGCNGVSVGAEHLEALLTEAVLQALDNVRLTYKKSRQIGDPTAEYTARLKELAIMFADGQLTRGEHAAARARVEAHIQTAEARSLQTGQRAALAARGKGLRQDWPTLGTEQQRSIVATLIDRITVNPGRGRVFNPDRVAVVWRA